MIICVSGNQVSKVSPSKSSASAYSHRHIVHQIGLDGPDTKPENIRAL